MKVKSQNLHLLLFFLFFWNLPAGVAQQEIVRCYTMEADQALREQYPEMGTLEDFEEWLAPRVRAYRESAHDRAVITVPIIFHIVHNGGSDNISAAYVNAQIDQLNHDFRRILGTSGYNNDPRGADTELEFCPATADPNGNALPEPGINRIDRSSAGFTAPPYTQSYIDGTIKPNTIWNPDNYVNVWVIQLSGGLLGYAQFPSQSGLSGLNSNGGPANTDGVVVLYSSVGSTGTPFPGGSPYNEGRTLTHELGHFFGLRHIWGDANCGNDYCADTPQASGPADGCPTKTTCDGQLDMVENYMDYSSDNCMNIFTNDQKARIQTVLANSPRRSTLSSSPACNSNGGGGLSCAATVSSFPYSEGWESSFGAWTQSAGDDFDWARTSGGTPSSNTGPAGAFEGSFYAFIESSSPNYSNKTAILNSPCFDLAGATTVAFTFQYHLYGGGGMGGLFLEASTDGAAWTTLWSQTGNQGNQWFGANVDLSAYAGSLVQLRFRGLTGTTWQGDMAIDDLAFSTSTSGGDCHNLSLSIILDNYPAETSWQITDAGGAVVASGGTYGSQSAGSTVVETACLPDGCYDFTISDTYGDGICCAYGNGSYILQDDAGNVLASGGSFTSSETTNFCLPASGGGDGPSCSTTVSSFPYSEGWESSFGAWAQATDDDFDWTRTSGGTPSSNTGPAGAFEGSFYSFMESSSPNYPNKTAILNSPCFNLASLSSPTFNFNYYLYGASAMGGIFLEANTDGSNWTTLWSQTGNQGNQWFGANVDLSAYAGSLVQLRFRGLTGTTWQGDMAIDALTLAEGGGGCSSVTLTIVLDNYPEETSWQITDAGGALIASGGTYGSQPDGSTILETECLPDGCYDFTILDAYGDGICCSYGNGSYTLQDDSGNILASGGSFASSETAAFCLPGGNQTLAARTGALTPRDLPSAALSCFPNPARQALNVRFTAKEAGHVQLRILDPFGRTLSLREWPVAEGKNQQQLDVTAFDGGAYLLLIEAGNSRFTRRFVVVK